MSYVVLIVNSQASSVEDARDVLDDLAEKLHARVLEPESREQAVELARRAADENASLVVVAGGDGTVNATIAGLVDSGRETALAVLPLGTGNDLARTLGVPLDVTAACELLSSPRLVRLDLVRVTADGESMVYANVATGGDTARGSTDLEVDDKRRWGQLSFLRRALADVLDPTVYSLAIELDGGEPERHEVVAAVFANARTAAGGVEVAPGASPDDALLDVVLIRQGGVAELAGLAAHYVLSDLRDSELVALRRARGIVVRSEPALPLSVDGEELGPAREIELTVLPAALSVVIGPDYGTEKHEDPAPRPRAAG